MRILSGVIAGIGVVTLLAGAASAMVCEPGEVAVKTKVDLTDVNGNVVVNGTPGCAQSVTPEGRIRTRTTRLNVTPNGQMYTQIVQIDPLPAEITGREAQPIFLEVTCK